ncbi:Reverse transcriptase, RNA-dependent DNA polymerase [Penicillium camemberti]|uniref:Reverse transcriptase, RNA-dependent DNA polymerase n=1 Tax=Penicillium camemberti (strain FM 013) TaxID=1429867 RepID=A0A0G4PXA5_PENC3|nr:Reverse transcriptase, RNA-dependent DNA polymerase [Penicillium camemberti]
MKKERYPNDNRPPDRLIYEHINLYEGHLNTPRDSLAAKNWWAVLEAVAGSKKGKYLKLFFKHETLHQKLNSLLVIPGLWEGMRIGLLHKVTAMHCDEPIACYWGLIFSTFSRLVGGRDELLPLVDGVTVELIHAVLRGWKLHQFDVVIAFSHGDIDSSICMELPEGFEEPGYVCRLYRSLYGLKQAPRIWYQCVHRVLAAHGFTMAQSDNCVFYKSNCVICVYVDDFLVAAANSHKIEQVQRALQTEIQLNDLGTPRSFLGIQFDYHADGDKEAKARFATAIGLLIYLIIGTRPDIAFALIALQRLLRYIKAIQSRYMTYRNRQLIGYTDADFRGSVVTDSAYSTSSYVFQLTGALVSWSSKRQGEVARSMIYTEYIGQYKAILYL